MPAETTDTSSGAVAPDESDRGVLDEIAARSATLEERIARARDGGLPVQPPELLPQILSRWARVASGGDLAALVRRLSWDGFEPSWAAAALSAAPPGGAADRAPWIADLERYAKLAGAPLGKPGKLGKDVEPLAVLARELPFGELWLPWAVLAAEQAAPVFAAHRAEVSEGAFTDLVAVLLREVTYLSEMAALERLDERRRATGASGAWASFVSDVLADPLGELYLQYPVLARQTCRALAQWRSWSGEVLERLANDRAALAETFGGGSDLGRLVGLSAGYSDRHHEGRRVLALRFESGCRLAYKPRPVGSEAALALVLEWCAARGLEPALRAPRTLARPGYGYVEWVDAEPLGDEAAVREYFRRAGALVAVMHVLRGEDLHGENLVATAAGPVVVDPEVLLQPRRERVTTGEGEHTSEASAGSCLATGLLTALQPDGREIRELGGLRAPPQRRVDRRVWSDLGTDGVACLQTTTSADPLPSVLRLGERPVAVEDYRNEVGEGFESGYRFLMAHREELLHPNGPLASLRSTPVRVLFRSSQEYGRVVSLMGQPRNQRSGVAGSFLLEAMLGSFQAHGERPATWPLVRAERSAMEARDIPWFSIAAGERRFAVAGAELPGLIGSSGLEAVEEVLRGLTEADLVAQRELVSAALSPPRIEGSWSELAAAVARGAAPIAESESASARWSGVAAGIGTLLCARPEGLSTRLGRWDLYAGRPGWSLFLAALARSGGAMSTRFRDQALEWCSGERGEGPGDAVLEALPIGGYSGLGGLAWAMVWLSELLDAPRLLEHAAAAADRIVSARIDEDRGFDLERGAAGAAFGLLAVARATGETRYSEAARRCGEHLLAHQVPTGSAGAAWLNPAGLAQTGLAHGASGIAHALLALARETGDGRFAVAAVAALGHERALFEPKLGNWPVLTIDGRGRHGRAWRLACCRGAPGIALARLHLPPELRDEAAQRELESALDTTAGGAPGRLHSLCCGSFGRSSVLLAAAMRGGGERRLLQAAELADEGLAAAQREGGFVLALDVYANRLLHPGLLQGVSGIGYQLLRLAGAVDLPDALALELPGTRAVDGSPR